MGDRLELFMPKKQSTAARRARAAARQGVKYTSALRSEETPAGPARTFPGSGRLWVSSWTGDPYGDANPACGHHLRARCGGCGVCATCDGCYCREAAEEARIDAEIRQAYEQHAEHDEHRADCYLCEDERVKSEDYARCWKCSVTFRDGRFDLIVHTPGYCFKLHPQPSGIDWSYLLGRDVRLVGTHFTITGHVPADQTPPDPAELRPHLTLVRTDKGYEGEVSPFNPREWLEIHPAPAGA
ncbi:hypothetical protein ACPCBF_25410 [Streptomyces pseudogriseolus]|uniref:hypothetical protein n=1 Tax=Streptomyces pseudogriseolus TaxID=36817 RepID=UPI003FA2E1DC